jgi:hypothetical protein
MKLDVKVIEEIDVYFKIGYIDGQYVLIALDEDGDVADEFPVMVLTPEGMEPLSKNFVINEYGALESYPLLMQ